VTRRRRNLQSAICNLQLGRGLDGAARSYRPWECGWLPNETLRRAISGVVPYARGALLDVGSGLQPYRELFQPYITSYTALDRPSAQYYHALTTCYGDALELPFHDGSFDTVLAFEVLEHLPDSQRFFSEVARVLAPGGCLLLTTPHIWGLHDEPYDFYRFTPHGLRALCERHGLRPLVLEPVAGYWVTAGARFSYYLHRFRRLRGIVEQCAQLGVQQAALLADRLDFVPSDAWNHVLVARRS
jgi:SAM-dependent methyltransferase